MATAALRLSQVLVRPVPALRCRPSLEVLRFRELGIILLNRQPLEFHRLRLRLGVARRFGEMRLQVRLTRFLPDHILFQRANGASKSRRRGRRGQLAAVLVSFRDLHLELGVLWRDGQRGPEVVQGLLVLRRLELAVAQPEVERRAVVRRLQGAPQGRHRVRGPTPGPGPGLGLRTLMRMARSQLSSASSAWPILAMAIPLFRTDS